MAVLPQEGSSQSDSTTKSCNYLQHQARSAFRTSNDNKASLSKVSTGNGAQSSNQETALVDMVRALPREELQHLVRQLCSGMDSGRKQTIALEMLPSISILQGTETLNCMYCMHDYPQESGMIRFLACCFPSHGVHFVCDACVETWGGTHPHKIQPETSFLKISNHVFRAPRRSHRELQIAGDGMGHEVVEDEPPVVQEEPPVDVEEAAVDPSGVEVVGVRPDGAHESDDSDGLRLGAEGGAALQLPVLVMVEGHKDWANGNSEGLPLARDDSKYIGSRCVKPFDQGNFIGTVVAWAAEDNECPAVWRVVYHDLVSTEILITLDLHHRNSIDPTLSLVNCTRQHPALFINTLSLYALLKCRVFFLG